MTDVGCPQTIKRPSAKVHPRNLGKWHVWGQQLPHVGAPWSHANGLFRYLSPFLISKSLPQVGGNTPQSPLKWPRGSLQKCTFDLKNWEPARPLQVSLGPFRPEMPKKSRKYLPGRPSPGTPKSLQEVSMTVREVSGESLESVWRVVLDYPGETFSKKILAFRVEGA